MWLATIGWPKSICIELTGLGKSQVVIANETPFSFRVCPLTSQPCLMNHPQDSVGQGGDVLFQLGVRSYDKKAPRPHILLSATLILVSACCFAA